MYIKNPRQIEAKSFSIVEKYLKKSGIRRPERDIVQRVVHSTADAFFIKNLTFHHDAVRAGINAIRSGKNIITDVNMVKAGINQKTVSEFGMKVLCYASDKNVEKKALQQNLTKAILSMRTAAPRMKEGIVAIGNSPTALFELCDLVENKKAQPSLIIGVPVGFVGAKESKRRLTKINAPYITNISRRGGTPVAVAIVNALLKIAKGK